MRISKVLLVELGTYLFENAHEWLQLITVCKMWNQISLNWIRYVPLNFTKSVPLHIFQKISIFLYFECWKKETMDLIQDVGIFLNIKKLRIRGDKTSEIVLSKVFPNVTHLDLGLTCPQESYLIKHLTCNSWNKVLQFTMLYLQTLNIQIYDNSQEMNLLHLTSLKSLHIMSESDLVDFKNFNKLPKHLIHREFFQKNELRILRCIETK